MRTTAGQRAPRGAASSARRARPHLEGLEDRLTPSGNPLLLQAYYHALLNRQPDFPGASTFANELTAGVPANQVVYQIETATSNEYYSDLVQSYYQNFLHRQGSVAEMQGYINQLANGVSDEQVEAQILGSPEYLQNRGGGTNQGWLNAVYQDLLGRAWDGSSHLSELSGGVARQTVALEIMTDPGKEFAARQINDYYLQFLGRTASGDAGAAQFATELQAGQLTDEQIVAAIVGGTEFANLHEPVIG